MPETRTAELDVSVIVPTYNRRDVVLKCIDALAEQTLEGSRYEVIVADNGSTDGTADAVESRSPNLPITVRVVHAARNGANPARNEGIRHARGRILLFINDDTIADPVMLEEHLRSHGEHPEDAASVLGHITISPEVPHSFFADLHLDATFRQFDGRSELDWLAFITCNISVKKTFLLTYGLFEESIRYHEDIELSERLRHHGLRVFYNRRATSTHYHFIDEKDYLNIAKKEGKALAQWYKLRPAIAPELAPLGLYGPPPLPRNRRYAIADTFINPVTFGLLLRFARLARRVDPSRALYLYGKLYQHNKRMAMRHELSVA